MTALWLRPRHCLLLYMCHCLPEKSTPVCSLLETHVHFYWLFILEICYSQVFQAQCSWCHKDSVLNTITLPITTCDVGELLSLQLAKEQLDACFLAWQGLPCHGDGEECCNFDYVWLIHLLLKMMTNLSTEFIVRQTSIHQVICRIKWWKWWLSVFYDRLQQVCTRHHFHSVGRWKQQTCQT